MFSFVGDAVLDPFVGSGTTSLAAKNLYRNSIGYEINNDFLKIIQKKLQIQQKSIFDFEVIFIQQKNTKTDYKNEIKKLPYIFKDFHNFDKKVDPNKLNFGSKISHDNSNTEEKFFVVKEIISPEILKLNNNLVVRLIGIKENKQINGKAVEFLKIKTKSQKIFLKYDDIKYDENNNLLVYMYLKNKTFINAHLIKNGLVNVDLNRNFKNKEKFIKLEQING
jgi:modification methylase